MEMSAEEIKRNYNQAKSKKRQIKILADLNCCTAAEIEKIVKAEENRKADVPVKQEEQANIPEDDIKLSNITNRLYCRMDELDEQIKELEKEYRKIVIALEVIENLNFGGKV